MLGCYIFYIPILIYIFIKKHKLNIYVFMLFMYVSWLLREAPSMFSTGFYKFQEFFRRFSNKLGNLFFRFVGFSYLIYWFLREFWRIEWRNSRLFGVKLISHGFSSINKEMVYLALIYDFHLLHHLLHSVNNCSENLSNLLVVSDKVQTRKASNVALCIFHLLK